MTDKNIRALSIAFLIALSIAWLAVGHTTEHRWSSWIFLVILIVVVIILTIMVISRLRENIFDWAMLIEVVLIILYVSFADTEVSTIHDAYKGTWTNAISILSYVVTGAYAFFFLFLLIRYIQDIQEKSG